MPTFIKTGFWEKSCRDCKGYKGWLNLDELIQSESMTGPQGPQGIQGEQGEQGIQGIQGIQGETGAALTVLGSYPDLAAFQAGAGGSPGEPGTAWIIESDGSLYVWNTATNAWDDVGDLQGPAGPQGPQGIQGIQGIQGVQGIQGTAATIAVGTTTTGEPGTEASVVNVGTSSAAVFNFTIPRGDNPEPPFPATVYGLFAQTGNSPTITNTTVESTLIDSGVGTLSVPANGWSIGDSFRADFGGVINTGNNQTIRIRVKAGSVILLDSDLQTINNLTGGIWTLSINFTVRALGAAGVASIVSLGRFTYTKTVNGTLEGFSFNTVNNTTFSTTVSNTLDVTAQWGAASTSNSIYSDIFVLNKIF